MKKKKIMGVCILVLIALVSTLHSISADETIAGGGPISPAITYSSEITEIVPAVTGESVTGSYEYYVTKEFDLFPGNNWVNAVRIAAQADGTVVNIDIDGDDIADQTLNLDEGDNCEADLPTGTHITSNYELTVHQYDDYLWDWEMVILPELRFWDTEYFYGGIWSYGSGSNNHILIQAANDNTYVEIDLDNNGVADLSNTINKGEVWDINSAAVYDVVEVASYDSRIGAHITADEVIQVHAFAEHAAYFGSAYNVIPTSSLGYEYFVPYTTTFYPVGWDESDNIVVVATRDNTLVGIDTNHDSTIDVTQLLVNAGDSWAYPTGISTPAWSSGAWVASVVLDSGEYSVNQEKAIVVFYASPKGGHVWDGFMSQMVPKMSTRSDYWNTVSWETINHPDISTGSPYLYLFAYEDGTIVHRDVDNDGTADHTYNMERKDGGLKIYPEKCGEHYWIEDPDNHHVSMYQGWYYEYADVLSPVSYEINPLQVVRVEKDFRYTNVNFVPYDSGPDEILGTEDDVQLPAELGDLLPKDIVDPDPEFYDVEYVLKPKDGTVSSTNPGQLYGVINITGAGVTNVSINDIFGTQFDVNPDHLGGGIEVIRVNSAGYAEVITETQVTDWSVDNAFNQVTVVIHLTSPLEADEHLMIYVKFQTALKHSPPEWWDFINTAEVIIDEGSPTEVDATVEFY